MIQTRIIGKLLRGKATTFQIASACVLGGLIGAQPGFGAAPGIVVALLACLLVLNANLFFAGLIAGGTKLASLALVALQFEVGMLLVDGPLEPLARLAINAPVLAWFGFDNYVAVGGLALGGVIGVVSAVVVVKLIAGFRKKMADLESGSDRYKKWSSKGWVKFLSWLLIGGNKGKKSYQELTESKGLPIRVPGVIVAVLLLGVVAAIPFVLTDSVVSDVLRAELGRANGATVDVGSASVDLGGGTATLTGLAVADRANLSRNLIEANTVNADFSTSDLLSKRVTMDEVVLVEVRRDTARATPGVLIGDADPTPTPDSDDENEGPLDDYLKNAEAWKERLEKVKDWLETQSEGEDDANEGQPDADDGTDTDASPGERRETLQQRLRRQARELGYARVTADHLIADHPRALIRVLRVEGVSSESDPRVFDINGTNVSTDPAKVAEPAELKVTSRDGQVSVVFGLPGASGGVPTLVALLTDLSADELAAQIKTDGEPPFRGGTVDLSLDASLPAGTLDAPLIATLRGATIDLPNVGPQRLDEFRLPIRLSGPLDNPTVRIDPDDLADALRAAGQSAAAAKLREEADKLTDDVLDKAGDAVPDDVKDKIKSGLGGLLGGGDDDEP
ncbi:MAG: hypothetical protein AAF297_07370 [Planctomycetota bacterium]